MSKINSLLKESDRFHHMIVTDDVLASVLIDKPKR